MVRWYVLRAQVEHHDRFTSQRDGCLDRLRDGKRSISFIQRKANNREIDRYEKAIQIDS